MRSVYRPIRLGQGLASYATVVVYPKVLDLVVCSEEPFTLVHPTLTAVNDWITSVDKPRPMKQVITNVIDRIIHSLDEVSSMRSW